LVVVGTHPLPPMNAGLARRRNEQLASLAEFARQTPDPLVMLGDLNITPWSPYFERLLADSGLRDGRGGHGLLPTWPVGWPMLWIPIDHVLVSDDVQIRRWQTGAVIGSDHYPVIVDFQLFGS
ncbi:MAG: endonuclease/exonuclease/phosphatase family protein, partial [Candidatus Competibacter sp.]